MAAFPHRQFTTPDGLTLVGDVGGPPGGAAVILLHGGGQTRHSWAGAMRGLVDGGYHVVNYDARGHGDSDWSPDGDYSLPALAADLRTVRATIDGPVALVGASMGGLTSFHAISGADAPIAEALVMVDIVVRPSEAGITRIVNFMTSHHGGFADLGEAAEAVAAYNPERPRSADSSGLLKNLRLRDDGRLYWHWDPRLMMVSRNAEAFLVNGLAEVSDRIRIPTLLVRGGSSDIVDDEGIADMRRLIPHIEVHDVSGAGHMVAGDRNDAFNEGVIAFLRRHLPAG